MARPKRVPLTPHLLDHRRRLGLTQEQVAERIGATPEMVRRHERGLATPTRRYLVCYCTLYEADAAQLGFPSPAVVQQPSTALSDAKWLSPGVGVAGILSEVTQKDLTLNRRELGQLFTSLFVGSPLLDRLEHLLSTPIPAPATTQTRLIGHDEVTELETVARLFREWDDEFGGGLRRKAVVGQLNEIADLLAGPHPPVVSRRLHAIAAQLAETAAMMSWDSGHEALAQRYYIMALNAAKLAGDLPFAANILAGMARQAIYANNANDALKLVHLAQSTASDHASASTRSMLYTREAWAYAAMGQVTAFQRSVGQAEDAFADAEPATDPHWIRYFDLAELNGTIGGRLLELASTDQRHAVAASDRITEAISSRRPGRLRSSALDEIGLAESLLIRDDFDEAAHVGHKAIDTATHTSSDRVAVQLVRLYQTTRSHARAPVIADLRDRLKPLCHAHLPKGA
jgi:transcriptional regulator with XRE-family HTH domain